MLRRLARALTARRRFRAAGRKPAAVQSGAIPYVLKDGAPVYLLITSRRTGRWIFPKGAIEPDMTPAQSAAREAWEEAGVRGRIEQAPIGAYHTVKVQRHSRRTLRVEMHALQVDDQTADWPERGSRRRHWATYRQARRLIDNPELLKVLDDLQGRLSARQKPSGPISPGSGSEAHRSEPTRRPRRAR